MLIGLLAGLGTGALWGLTFVAPRAVRPFTELDLAIWRYAIFGLVSLVLMAIPRFRPSAVSARRFMLAIGLGGVGYVVYYVLAAYAVRLAGPAIPPLIIGALPVALAIIGNWQDRQVAWRMLLFPLALIFTGLAVVNLSTISGATSPEAQSDIILGMASAIGAFLIWIVYGVINSKVMLAPDAPDPLVWTGLQGVGTAICIVPLIPIAAITGATALPAHALSSPEGQNFILWALALGIPGSWIATWLWGIASKKLPLALSAQLIVAETVFGLIYGFIYEARWPTRWEWLGTGLLIAGVLWGVGLFRMRPERAAVG